MLSHILCIIVFSVIALSSHVSYAGERETIAELLHGYFLAAGKQYKEAATRLAAVGEQQKNPHILASAVKVAILTDINLAQQYAIKWRQYGGGTQAEQVIAELYIYKDELDKAEQILATLMSRNAQTSNDLFRQLYAIKDKAAALAMGQRLFPKDGDGQFQLTYLALRAEDFTAAEAANANAIQHDPKRTELYFLRADISQQQADDTKQILTSLEAYVAANCHETIKHCSLPAVLAAYQLYVSRQQNQQDWLDTLNAEIPNTTEWHRRAGNFYERLDLLARAKTAYQAAADDFESRLGLARIAEEEGGAAAALAILLATTVNEERYLVIRETTIARLLEKTEGLAAAIQRLKKAQQTVPNNFSLMYHEALYLEETDKTEETLKLLQLITTMFPENSDGWNALGYIMADNNRDLKTAKSHIERALAQSPNNPSYIDSLGWVNYRLGNLAVARYHLEKAASLSGSVEIAAHLGEVLWEISDINQAKRVWKKALADDPDNRVLNETLQRYKPF